MRQALACAGGKAMTFQFPGFQHRLHLDYETRSVCNIKTAGSHKYARDPSTRALMLGWAVDDEPVQLWLPDETPMPARLYAFLMDPNTAKVAFNAAFERQITQHVIGIDIPVEQWRCTMVASYYLAFAGGLDQILEAIGLQKKDPRGQRLINLFCTPAPKNHKAEWYDQYNKPAEWEEFKSYCRQDVRVERQLLLWLAQFPMMHEWDWSRYALDQKINDRGVPMSMDMARGAVEMWDAEKTLLTTRLQHTTELPKVTRGPFAQWLADQGCALPDLTKESLAAARDDEATSATVKEALTLWMQKEAKATSKYTAAINGTDADGRARGMFQFKGASRTDRTSGRRIQLQNLKRTDTKPKGIPAVVGAVKSANPELLHMITGKPVSDALGGAIRHVIQASPGKTLVVNDLTSIESVVLGWLAMCPSIDETFRAGRDSYRMFAMNYFGIEYDEVTKQQRSFAKPPVLGCFAADTLVLTRRGWVPIVCIRAQDEVWDGVEWVNHSGIINQGVKPVIEHHGVRATPDHEVHTEEGWAKWSDLQGESIKKATESARGPLRPSLAAAGTYVNVTADTSRPLAQESLVRDAHGRVSSVPTEDWRVIGHLPPVSELRSEIMIGWPTGSMPQGPAARTPQTQRTHTTAAGASECASTPQSLTFDTSYPCQDGTTQTLRLTGLTTGVATNEATYDSRTGQETLITPGSTAGSSTTDGSSQPPSSGESFAHTTGTKAPLPENTGRDRLRSRSSLTTANVYDVVNAGPRNRFTILTSEGPVIVHNCGFMLGWKGLIAYSTGYGVDMTEDQARNAVNTFRTMYPEIPQFWKWIYDAAKYVITTGQPISGYRLHLERDSDFLRIWLPSGRALSYFKPEVRKRSAPWAEVTLTPAAIEQGWCKHEDLMAATGASLLELEQMGYVVVSKYLDNVCYMGQNDKNQWTRIYAHAGLFTENIVQSIAMDILFNGITNADAAGLSPVLQVHDEIGCEEDKHGAEAKLELLGQCMTTQPDWCRDMWLGADGYICDYYTKD